MIKVKRVYDEPSSSDGFRILVDRLWPRGISKDRIDLWLKEVAPSNELRKWFNHEPAKWPDFQKKYKEELKNNPAVENLKEVIKEHSPVTLLFGAHDTEYNQAIVLKNWLEE